MTTEGRICCWNWCCNIYEEEVRKLFFAKLKIDVYETTRLSGGQALLRKLFFCWKAVNILSFTKNKPLYN